MRKTLLKIVFAPETDYVLRPRKKLHYESFIRNYSSPNNQIKKDETRGTRCTHGIDIKHINSLRPISKRKRLSGIRTRR
jgi:hypothetical protein